MTPLTLIHSDDVVESPKVVDYCAGHLNHTQYAVLYHLAARELEDSWQTWAEIRDRAGLVPRSNGGLLIAQLLAFEVIERTDFVPLAGGRRCYRVTARGLAVVELARNPSAASERVRAHLATVVPLPAPDLEPAA